MRPIEEVADFTCGYPVFTPEMKATHTILIPDMLPWHFDLLVHVMRREGYKVEVLHNEGRAVIDEGLKHVHNDTCFPALCVIGQYLDALKSGKYDPARTAVLITQSGGGCRASNYIPLIRKAMAAEFPQVPVLSLNFGFDVLPMLESWLTLGDVKGSVNIEDGNLKHMTTSQDIELLLPNEDADFLAYNVDNFPDLVMEFFETHKLSVPIDTGGLTLTLTINGEDEFAEGIGLTANVSSEADYALLSSDVTFEQIAEDYAAHVGSVRV